MEKFYNYLQKIGIEERPRKGSHMDEPPRVFYRTTYGDANYFENAPNHTHPGAVVIFDYNADAPAEYFQELRESERRLRAYCKKYGYFLEKSVNRFDIVFKIEKDSDKAAANTYFYYRDAARHECELFIHNNRGKESAYIESGLRAIMDAYGAAYVERLNAEKTA